MLLFMILIMRLWSIYICIQPYSQLSYNPLSNNPPTPTSYLAPKLPSIHHPRLHLLIRPMQIIINNNQIMDPLPLRKRHLLLRLLQPLPHTLLIVRPPPLQPLPQDLHRRRRQEQKPRIQICFLDLLHALANKTQLHLSGPSMTWLVVSKRGGRRARTPPSQYPTHISSPFRPHLSRP